MVLNTTELYIIAVTKYILVFKVCQAIVEDPTKTIALLHTDVLNQFEKLVDDFDDPNLYTSQLDIGRV